MIKQRDELGRFIKGNTVARGNRGNRTPKYGNQNALKHGLFARAYSYFYEIQEDNTLYVSNGETRLTIQPEGYKIKNKRIYIRDDIAKEMEMYGFGLFQG